MGFTIEDMRLVSEERYKMEFIAGRNGWSNSISWLLMLEDLTIIQHFTGKELFHSSTSSPYLRSIRNRMPMMMIITTDSSTAALDSF